MWTGVCCAQTQSIASCEKDAVSSSSLTTEQRPATTVHAQYFPDAVNQITPVLA